MVPATLVAVLLLSSTGCAAVIGRQASNSPGASPSELAEAPSDSPAASSSPGTSPTPARSPSTSPTPARSPSPGSSPTPSSSPTPAKLVITSLPFHVGEVGVAYAAAVMGAKGGVPPYHWSISSGTFPTGLALSSGGSASGTPSAPGAFSFVVRVGDSAGAAAGAGGSITVARHLTIAGSCVTTCSVEQGCSVCGVFGSQTGGVAPFKYARNSGSLPSGTTLKGLSLAGTFTTVSKFSFGVMVTDSLGATRSVTANFNVFRHITFTITSAACNQSSAACSTRLTYVGGTPNGKPTVKVGKFLDANGKPEAPPPNGYSVSASGGIVNFSAAGQIYFATVTLILVDQNLCGPSSAHCSSNTATVTINL